MPAVADRLGRDFWRLWSADGLSNLADGILKVGLPLIAVGFTDSPAVIAGLAFVITLPWLLFALPAGAVVDRVDRRVAMLAANTTRAAAMALVVLATAAGFGALWVLFATALFVGVAEVFYDTAAQSILPQIVSRDRLPAANSKLFAVELTAHEFVGPPLAGVLVAVGSVAALATPLGMWIAAIGAMALLRGSFKAVAPSVPGTPGAAAEAAEAADSAVDSGEAAGSIAAPDSAAAAPRRSLRADVLEGLRFVAGSPILRTLAVMTGLFNLGTSAMFAVFVLFATGDTSEMHLSKQGYGLLFAVIAAGSVAGSFVAERAVRVLGRARALFLSLPMGALLVGIPAVTTNIYAIGAGFFVGGATGMVWNVITISLRQRLAPDRLLGRVNSAYRLLAWGAMPIGSALGGLVAQLFGVRAVFVFSAVVTLGLLLGMRVLTDRAMTEAEERADDLGRISGISTTTVP